MTPVVVSAIVSAAGVLLAALVGAFAGFTVQRATATKLATDSHHVEANTAEVFTRLAAEWTKRADDRVDKLDAYIAQLVAAIETLTEAVDNVAPLLQAAVVQEPESAEKVAQLAAASRTALRLAR